MSNYVEYNNKIAFHPGYYIKEIVDETGLTQEDFAKRLDTTPKNLSLLIRGEQSLSVDIAKKLSRLLGTSIKYWLNLQNSYDALIAEFDSEKELDEERKVFKFIDYGYLRDNFGLPDLSRKIDQQIIATRSFLNVSSLTVLSKYDMAASFRSSAGERQEANRIKANTMVQIAINHALEVDAPSYDMHKFEKAVEEALGLTCRHDDFYPLVKELFFEAGVIFYIMPNLKGSKINGATKKIGNSILLMVNSRGKYADTFWFTLFHEIGHIIAGDYGVSYENDISQKETAADTYAKDKLIPPADFCMFLDRNDFSPGSVIEFSRQINRDPGIVAGRLFKERIMSYSNTDLNGLRKKYRIICNK